MRARHRTLAIGAVALLGACESITGLSDLEVVDPPADGSTDSGGSAGESGIDCPPTSSAPGSCTTWNHLSAQCRECVGTNCCPQATACVTSGCWELYQCLQACTGDYLECLNQKCAVCGGIDELDVFEKCLEGQCSTECSG